MLVQKYLVYLELRRRGYDVSVGIHGQQDIDFVAANTRNSPTVHLLISTNKSNYIGDFAMDRDFVVK